MEEEYVISPGTKVFYGLIGAGAVVFALVLMSQFKPGTAVGLVILPFGFLALGALIFINLGRKKVILSETSIRCISLFSTKEMEFSAVKGCRVGSKTMYLVPLSADDSTMIIGNYSDLEGSEQLAAWVKAHFKDLEQADLDKSRTEVMQDPAWGATEKERRKNLDNVEYLAWAYNGFGFLLGMTLIAVSGRVVTLLLLVYPLLGVALLFSNKGMIKFISGGNRSVRAPMAIGALLPCFVLFGKSLEEYALFSLAPLWLPALGVSALLFVVFYIRGISRPMGTVWLQLVFMGVMALLYGFGAVREVNCGFDASRAQVFSARVMDHRVQGGRGKSYYLTLGRWGPVTEENDVEVQREVYHAIQIDDTVRVELRGGLLGIPWVVVRK
jgi:hypothetical protein